MNACAQQKVKSLVRRPHKLRWQLTLRFAGVTIATLLILLAGLFGYLFYQILVANWQLSPETWINVAARTAVPTTRHILTEERENRGMITMWLSYVANPTSTFRLVQMEEVEVTLRTTGSASAFLFDERGILLGASDAAGYGSMVGQSFTKEEYPTVGESVEAALRGETEPELLVRPAGQGDNSFSVAVPIFADDISSGQLLGALAVSFESLSTDSAVARYTLRFAAISSLVLVVLTSAVAVGFAFVTAKSMTDRVARMAAMADRWSKGDFVRFISDGGSDEVGMLSDRLDSMAAEMSALLNEREKTAASQERSRMARDLHDSVKQTALAASFQIGTALSVIKNDSLLAATHIREADELLNRVRSELAALIDSVYAAVPGEYGLEPTVRSYLNEWSRRAGIAATMEQSEIPVLERRVESGLFRIVQEALANVARHSGANHVQVRLDCVGDVLVVEVVDDGSGFDVSAVRTGVGLRSMRERSQELGGTFNVDSEPGTGTRIRVEVSQGWSR